MNSNEVKEISEHLKSLGKNTLILDRYLIKKAWALYYAVWATAILIFLLLPSLLGTARNTTVLLEYAAIYAAIIGAAVYTVSIVFRKALLIMQLNDILYRGTERKNFDRASEILTILLLVTLILPYSGAVSGSSQVMLSTVTFSLLGIYVYFILKSTFKTIPVEGLIAVSIFMISNLGSGISQGIYPSSILPSFFWVPSIVVWFLIAVYSYLQAYSIERKALSGGDPEGE